MRRILKYIILGCFVGIIFCFALQIIFALIPDKEYEYHVYYKTREIYGRANVIINRKIDCNAALVEVEKWLKKDILSKGISGFDPNDPLIVVSWEELEM